MESNKILGLPLVKNTLGLFGIDGSTKKTNAKKIIKEKIENGELKVNSLSKEQADSMLEHLKKVRSELETGKDKMKIEEMESIINELELVSVSWDQVATSNYNVVTKDANADKQLAKEVASAIAELTQVFDKEIKLKEQEEKNKRIDFIKNWTVEQLKLYQDDVYDFVHDWRIFYDEKLMTQKTALNYNKDGVITSPSKKVKDSIINKLNDFKTAKTTIENHKYKSVVYDYYIKNGYDLNQALIQTQEYERLRIEQEEREKLEREREERERAEAQERLRLEEEAKLAELKRQAEVLEAEKEMLETNSGAEDILDLEVVDYETEENVVEVNYEVEEEPLTKDERIEQLKMQIHYEEMGQYADRSKIEKWQNEIETLTGNTSNNAYVAENQTEKEKMVKYTLTTKERPKTQLNDILEGAGVKVNSIKAVYEIEIESSRTENFEKYLMQNEIEILEKGEK